jgi:hypothetical protein
MDLRHFKLEKSKPYDVIICDYDMPIWMVSRNYPSNEG